MEKIDEIKTIDIEIEKKIKEPIIEPIKEIPKEKISEIEKYNTIKKIQEEMKRKRWEEHLGGRKIVDPNDYDKLKKRASLFNAVKYFLIFISIVTIIILLIWAIQVFKNKDFSQDIQINNTNNLPETNVQAPINLEINNTNSPNINLNISVNIDKVITNSS